MFLPAKRTIILSRGIKFIPTFDLFFYVILILKLHVNKNERKTKQNEHFEFPGIDFEFLSETAKSAQ